MNTRTVPLAFRAQRFLRGLRYPASKAEVIRHALRRGAEAEVVRALRALDERVYESPTSLARSMAVDGWP